MAPKTFDLIAIISPKAGKVDRLVELLTGMCAWVKANEPNTLRYELIREVNKKSGVEQVIMMESYVDRNALRAHSSSKEFLAFQKKLTDENLTDGEMQLKIVQSIAGFSRL